MKKLASFLLAILILSTTACAQIQLKSIRQFTPALGANDSDAILVSQGSIFGGGPYTSRYVTVAQLVARFQFDGYAWVSVTGTPTTLSGYGITDAMPLAVRQLSTAIGVTDDDVFPISQPGALFSGTFVTRQATLGQILSRFESDGISWAFITSTPTTLAGYGITDSLLTPHAAGTPTAVVGSGAGGGGTVSVSGSDVSGVVTLITGTAPSNGATAFVVTFNTAYAVAPNSVTLTGADNVATAIMISSPVSVPYTSLSTTGFTVRVGSVSLPTSTIHFYYSVSQQ